MNVMCSNKVENYLISGLTKLSDYKIDEKVR